MIKKNRPSSKSIWKKRIAKLTADRDKLLLEMESLKVS